MIKQITSDFYGAENHGGAKAIVNGRKCSFGSIRGFTIYNLSLWNIPKMAEYERAAAAKDKPLGEYLAEMIKIEVENAEAREAARPKWEHSPRYWINLQATVLSSSPGYYEEEERRWADAPRLSVGDIVDFDGNLLRIVSEPNGNFGLVPV